MTTVTPMATPPAMRNWGLASNAKIAGEDAFSAVNIPGLILVRRLEISAKVSATAAIASGFAWRLVMMAVAECCKQWASRSKASSFDIVVASSSSRCASLGELGRRSGGSLP